MLCTFLTKTANYIVFETYNKNFYLCKIIFDISKMTDCVLFSYTLQFILKHATKYFNCTN